MRKHTKNIQGGIQLRDKARSMKFAQSKRQCIVQEVFHVYLNKFEIAVTHSFLIIFGNF